MHNAKPRYEFIAHSKALEAAGIAIDIVGRLPVSFRVLADQVVRSASSVPANLDEGAGRSGKDRLHHWRIAYGSAREVDTHLQFRREKVPGTAPIAPPFAFVPAGGGGSTRSYLAPGRSSPLASAAAMAASSSGVGVGLSRSSATARAMLSGMGSPGLGS